MLQKWLERLAASLRRRRLALGISLALLALYTLAGFLLVPALIRHYAQAYVSQTLGRQLQIGQLQFNPFRAELRIHNLQLREADGRPLLGFAGLRLDADPLSSLFTRSINLTALQLQQPDVNLVLAADGSLNLAQLAPPASQPTPPPAPGPLPAVRIDLLDIEDGRLHVEDHSRAQPFALELRPLHLHLAGFRTQIDYQNHYQFSASTAAGEQLDWSGQFTVQPLGSSGELRLRQLQLKTVADYLQQQLPVRLADGTVDLAGQYQLQLAPQLELALQLPQIQIQRLALAEQKGRRRPLRVAQIGLKSLDFSLARRRLQLDTVSLQGLQLDLQRERNGQLSLMRLLPAPGKPDAQPPAASKAAEQAPFAIKLRQLQLRDGRIALEDRSLARPLRLQLQPLSLSVDNISNAPDARPQLSLQTGLRQNGKARGQLQAQAQVQLSPLAADLQLDLQQLDLPMLEPYLAQYSGAQLHSGRLGVKAQVRYQTQGKQPQISARAELGVDELRAVDRAQQQDFLRWKRLQVQGLDYRQAAQSSLRIAQVQLEQPYARAMIHADQTLNIAQILAPPGTPATAATPAKPAAAPAASTGPRASASPAMALRIDRLRIQDGSAYFADQSIQPSFAASILALKGEVDGLSSDPQSRARIQLSGNVDRYAPVQIAGSANLLSATQFFDLGLSFRNMELSTFNPYSGKFAGYNIDKGKLSTELHYRIQDRQLSAEHHVILDQLEFGEATGSKDAAPLPIKLAVALLKDRHGIIDLELPVRGSLDDPDFRYGKLIWKVALNLLTRIATAPFAALGSLFGGGEDLQFLEFAAGSAQLDAAQNQKLGQLRRALDERPQLKLDVPITRAAADRPVLAQQALQARLAPAAGASPQEQLRALEKLNEALKNPAPEYPQPSDTAARIALLQARLLPQFMPDDETLDRLGRERAQAVQQGLLGDGGLAPERLFIVGSAPQDSAEDNTVRMELKLQ